jgi:glycerate-2-kinase
MDDDTVRRATEAGLDVAEELRRHNTCGLLSGIGDAIDTGILNTNVQDLRVVYVGAWE